MLLIRDDAFDERRTTVRGPLAPLADSLASELAPLMAREIYIPTEKALLSREGGRCSACGTALEFDPFAPREHRCAKCGTTYTDELHHRAWIYPYQLWLAERAVHGALLHALRGDDRHASLARDILLRYANAYAGYPNVDNVLGPTRLFFSTYLESIWLLQICIATDLLAFTGDHALRDEVREKIIRPSSAIIAEYDEGLSNRQVWNNAALMAAALLLGDRSAAERVIRGASGVEMHLSRGLLGDGTWYEGENYHLFAHRGLWYTVTMAESAGIALDATLAARFREAFATPFATALPDLTLPSRKDSQYAISLRQWRLAELCELGLARGDDARLVGALAQLYADDIPRRDTGRARSCADVERNLPASQLSRADLGWRALLHARPELPSLTSASPKSAHLEAQGVTVFRRAAGDVYVALDWGQSGGGHGHPDRLNVTFAHHATRWLDDLGTGSYVDPSLHWYRSSLAHNAPLIDGQSQRPVSGTVIAHDERGGVGWILAAVDGIAPGVHVERALIVTPDYFVDEVTWSADRDVRFELPVHFDGAADGLPLSTGTLDGGDGEEDGFQFVRDARAADLPAGTSFTLTANHDGRGARAWMRAAERATVFHAKAPGQPATAERAFYVVRCHGSSGVIRSVWSWSPRISGVTFTNDTVDITLGDERHVHRRTSEYWQIEMSVGAAHSGIELYGWRPTADALAQREASSLTELRGIEVVRNAHPVSIELGADHYRRSEQSWEAAGRPTATVALSATNSELVVDVRVATHDAVFASADSVNPFDNEHPDVNGHGVQLYVRDGARGGGWMLVPDPATSRVRVRALEGWGSLTLVGAEWTRNAEGFELRVRVPLRGDRGSGVGYRMLIDVIVNDASADRARRRGQLVLSGARGEFVYLRGDRHEHERLVPLLITP